MNSVSQQHFDKAVSFFDKNEDCDDKNFPIVVKELKLVLNLEPDFAPAHYYIALAYTNMRQFDNAIVHFD